MIEDLSLNPDEIMFGQGTLRPDLIESASGLASGHADLIKTHHNDTELVRQLRAKQKVVEPLTEFHKDEVKIQTQRGKVCFCIGYFIYKMSRNSFNIEKSFLLWF